MRLIEQERKAIIEAIKEKEDEKKNNYSDSSLATFLDALQ